MASSSSPSALSRAVFLSYASQDAEAARRICDALRAAGVEVWFDQSELVGGDAWDQKIRKQIKECALFVPVISANTQSRLEGYFRREWRMAVDRMHDMDDDMPFLVPVVIDDTTDAAARVPERFRERQWTRLPDGEASPAFIDRLGRLLNGEAAPIAGQSPNSSPPHALAPRSRPAQPARRPRLAIVAGAVAVALLATLVLWRPWLRATSPALAPLSEARKLTAQARALIDDDWLAVRENYRLAEELCQRATTLDPADGEAWATLARVSAEMIDRNYDTGPERRASARNNAERAVRLAPQSVESGLAMAASHALVGEHAEAVRMLRALLARAPGDARVALALASALQASGAKAEAAEIRLKHPAFGGKDPRPLIAEAMSLESDGRLMEAETLIDRAQALAPTLAGYRAKLRLLLFMWGDLEASRRYVQEIPPGLLSEDVFIVYVARMWLWLGQGDEASKVLKRTTREFLEDSGGFSYLPAGNLAGWASRLAGRELAAQAEWTQALAVVEQRLQAEPNRHELHFWKAMQLALIGRREEAAKTYAIYLELAGGRRAVNVSQEAVFHLLMGQRDEAMKSLETAVATLPIPFKAHGLRYSPWLASVQDDPRVQRWVAEGVAAVGVLRSGGVAPKSEDSPAARDSPPDAKSVAVLAFANSSGDKDNEYFSDGISDELLNVLGTVPGLKVSARTSAFHFKGKDTPIAEIARQLGVAYVVEGNVRKSGDRVRVSAQLIRAATNDVVWSSGTLERDLKDIFALQDEIAGLIAQNLQMKLGVFVGAARGAVNPEAHRLVLEGLAQWDQRTYAGFERAETLFTRALALDPNFAAAHAGLAQVSSVRRTFLQQEGLEDEQDHAGRAEAEALRALALDPTLAEAHMSLGFTYVTSRRWEEAERSFQQAVASNPNYAVVYLQQASLYHARGQFREALRSIDRGLELDPLSFVGHSLRSGNLLVLGRGDEASAASDRAETLRPPDSLQGRSTRLQVLWAIGRLDEAVQVAREILATPVGGLRLDADAAAIWTLQRAGQDAEAAAQAETLFKRWPARSYLRGYVLTAFGRFEEALPYLEHTPPRSLPVLYASTLFDPFRTDPRFEQLLANLDCLEEYRTALAELGRALQDGGPK